MNNCRIYTAFHREGMLIPNDPVYAGLQVGRQNSQLKLDMLHDASGNYISDKNEVYSELTGWYWIWQNQAHEIVGTAHYRRFFTMLSPSIGRIISKQLLFFIGLKKKRHGLWYVKDPEKWRDKILTEKEVRELLQNFDAILPQKKKFKYSVYEQYKRRHKEADIKLTRKILDEKHPDFLDAFDVVFASREMYSFNMFIMPWALFDEYMNWLFDVLFELEKRSKIDWNDKYQKRVCAFMAERLQTVWFQKKQLNIKELPILYFKKLKTEHF